MDIVKIKTKLISISEHHHQAIQRRLAEERKCVQGLSNPPDAAHQPTLP